MLGRNKQLARRKLIYLTCSEYPQLGGDYKLGCSVSGWFGYTVSEAAECGLFRVKASAIAVYLS
jgi:hypothetical protein